MVKLMRVPEACQALAVGRSAFYCLVRRGELRLVKLGRSSRVRDDDVQRVVNRWTVGRLAKGRAT